MPTTYDELFTQVLKLAKHGIAIRAAQIALVPKDPASTAGLREVYGVYAGKQASMLAPIADEDSIGDFGRMPMTALREAARKTVIETVDRIKELKEKTGETAWREIAAQMVADSDSIKLNAPTVSAVARGGNTGNGFCSSCVYAPIHTSRGVVLGAAQKLQFVRDEIIQVTCNSSTVQGRLSGSEMFEVRHARGFDPMDRRWRAGTDGRTYPQRCTSGTVDASVDFGQNIVRNGEMEDFDSNVPVGWSVGVGSIAGTHVLPITTAGAFYRGAKALRLVGDGSVKPSVISQFGLSDQIPIRLKPDAVYYVKAQVRSASGTVTKPFAISIVDGSYNNLCVSGVDSVGSSSMTTTFTIVEGELQTNYNLPSTCYLHVGNITTALGGSEELYVDEIVVVEAPRATPGSIGLVLTAGSTDFVVGDHFNVTVTNDDASLVAYWLDCFFDFAALGIVLPGNASPTIAESRLS